jgi:roadblock/LC7 domain-containing protein
MLDFLRTGRRPVDARDLLAMISAQYPDSEKALRVFVAACHDDQRYVRACILCSAANCGYSITSSASASNLSGTSTPSIRAVGWLMTSSNFAACTTGRSAVFAP